jgi:hypothetical protein
MRDGYMAPDRVIELAKHIKAEQEAKPDVFTDVEESEAEAPESRSETVNRHGRRESHQGWSFPRRLIPWTSTKQVRSERHDVPHSPTRYR